MTIIKTASFYDHGIRDSKSFFAIDFQSGDITKDSVLEWRTEGIQTEPSFGKTKIKKVRRVGETFCQFQTLTAGSGRIIVSIPEILEETAFKFTALELEKTIDHIVTNVDLSLWRIGFHVYIKNEEEIPDENTKLLWTLGEKTGQEECNKGGCFFFGETTQAGDEKITVSIPGILEESVIEFTVLPMDQPNAQEAALASPALVMVEEEPPVPVISPDQAFDNQKPLAFGVTPPDLEETADETPARVIIAGNGTNLPEAGNVTELPSPVRIRLLETAAPAKPPDSHPDDDSASTPASDNGRNSLNPASLDEVQTAEKKMCVPSFAQFGDMVVGRETSVGVTVSGNAISECFLGWRIEGINTDIAENTMVHGRAAKDGVFYEVKFTPKSAGSGQLVVWVPGRMNDTSFKIEVKPAPALKPVEIEVKPAPALKHAPASKSGVVEKKPAPASKSAPAPVMAKKVPCWKRWRPFVFIACVLIIGLIGRWLVRSYIESEKATEPVAPLSDMGVPTNKEAAPAAEPAAPMEAAPKAVATEESPVSKITPAPETTPACVIKQSWKVVVDGQEAWIAKCNTEQLVFCTSSATMSNGAFALDPDDPGSCVPAPLPPSGS